MEDAASDIRKGGALVKQEADRSTGQAKQSLLSSVQELDKLADGLQKRTVSSATELDAVFARTHHVLARYYQEKASESWVQKAIEKTGYYLRLSATHLENALTWARQEIEGSLQALSRRCKTSW